MSTPYSFLIIQTGFPPEPVRQTFGDPSDWFCRALDGVVADVTVVRPFLGEVLPDPKKIGMALITGSWAMVSDREPWSEHTAGWIRSAMDADTPLLGVCYGHQLIAHALGGEVNDHPDGVEMGVQQIELCSTAKAEPLLCNVPSQFEAMLAHKQSVLSLPSGARVLARSAHDPHQIVRYSPQVMSFQFHPEVGPDLMAACVHSSVAVDDEAAEQVLNELCQTPVARQLLRDVVAAKCAG